MESGKLRNKITFQSYINGTNENGFPTKTWIDIQTAWAEITPLQGNETFQTQTDQSKVDMKIACRYVSGITSDMLIKYGNRFLYIQSVLNVDERSRTLEIVATERVDFNERRQTGQVCGSAKYLYLMGLIY